MMREGKPSHLIEVKTSDDEPSKHFSHFMPKFPEANALQLVLTLKRQKTYPNGLAIKHLPAWLKSLF